PIKPKSGVKFTIFVRICRKSGFCCQNLRSRRPIFTTVSFNLPAALTYELDAVAPGITKLLRQVSVPKILTLFIPEILSHPAIAGRAKTLSVPPVGEPVGPREEDVRNVKASRSRNSTEGRSLQGRSGP